MVSSLNSTKKNGNTYIITGTGFFFLIANVSGKQHTKKRQGKAERNSYIIIAIYFCIII